MAPLLLVAAGANACASLSGLSGGGSDASTDASVPRDATRPEGGRDASTEASLRVPDGRADTADAMPCTTCGGACVDITSDPTNCGGCGVTCRQCTNGYCLNYLDQGDPGQYMPALAFLPPLVYWAGAADGGDDLVTGDVLDASVPKPERVLEMFSTAPLALAADRQSVFVGGAGYLAAFTPPSPLSASDGGLVVLNTGLTYFDAGVVRTANSVAVDDTNVYWSDSTTNAVLEMPKSGGQVVTLVPDQFSVTGVATDSSFVYWLADGSLYRISATGVTTPTTLAAATTTGTGPTPLVVHGGQVYFPDTVGSRILSIFATGGTPIPFATDQPNVTALATDGTSLYWTTNEPTGCALVKQPLAGGVPVTIASFGEADVVLPGGLALSAPPDGGAMGTTVFVSANISGAGVLLAISPPP